MGKIFITCLCCLLGIGINDLGIEANEIEKEQKLLLSSSCDITVEAGDEVLLCNGLPGQLNGSISGSITSFEWSPSDGLSSTTVLNPVVNISDETVYTLTVMGIGDNLVENGDFETGNINPSSSTFGYINPGSFPGSAGNYTVGNSGSILFLTGLCDGHTGPEMMVTNGPGSNVWCQGITVEPFTDYKLELWVGGVEILFLANSSAVDVKINGAVLGTVGGSGFCDWNVFQTVWNSGPSSNADICLDTDGGSDSYALIDDISFVECCVIKDEVTVYVEEVEAQILPAGPITCDNHPLILNGTLSTQGQGVTYEWTTNDGLLTADENTLTPEIDKPGVYKLIVTGERGCMHETEILVEGNVEPPEVGFVSANLDCMNDSAIVYIDTMFLPNLSYEWKGPNGFTSTQQRDTVTVPGKYVVIVRDQYNCETEDTIYVKDLRTQADFTLDIDSLNCSSDSAMITLNFQDSLATILWEGPNGYNSNARSIVVGEIGSYILTIFDSLDCPYTDTVIVEDNRVFPNILVDADTITCAQPFSNLFGHSDSVNITFHWTGPNGFVDNNPSPTTTDTGWYYLEIKMIGGCSSFDSVHVVSDGEIPTLDISGDTLTCNTDEINLEGITNDPNASVSWIGPNGFTSNQLVITVRDSGKYELTIINAKGCKIIKSYDVVSNMDLPEVLISGNNMINCKDEIVTLLANNSNAGIVTSWMFNNSIISNSNSIDVDEGGWYYLNKLNENGCLGIDSILIEVDTSKPIYSLFSDTINCINIVPEIRINHNDSDGNWFWYDQSTMTYSNADATINITEAGWYKIKVSKSNFCSVFDSIEVAVDTISPIINVSDDSLTCTISTLTLTASVVNNYSSILWTGPSGFNSDLLKPQVSEAGTYNVIVTAKNGCQSTASINITQEGTLPDIDAISDSLNCNKISVILQGISATNGAQFIWIGPNGFMSNMANPTVSDSGWYELTVIGEGGCSAKKRLYVGLDNEIPIESWDADTLTCLNTLVDILSKGASGNYAYLWTGPNGFSSSDQNISVSSAGFYDVIITGQNGCNENIKIVVEEDVLKPSITVSDDTLDCKTGEALLNFVTSSSNYSINWSGPNGFLSMNLNPSVSEEGSYKLTITDNENGCSSDQNLNVFPPNDIDAFHTITEGECASNSVDLIIDQITGGTGPYMYSFNGGMLQSNNRFSTMAGLVDVTVEDAKGCSFSEQIQVDSIDVLVGSLLNEISLNIGEKFNIQASTNRNIQDIASIEWTPSDGLSCDDCLNPILTASQDKLYQVKIIDIFGCEIILEIRIKVKALKDIFIPNSFSPNGDAVNDRFTIFTPEGSHSIIKRFQIYSRWGETVFLLENGITNEPLQGWDGNYNNKEVLPGVYVYHAVIVWSNGIEQEVNGSLTLVR